MRRIYSYQFIFIDIFLCTTDRSSRSKELKRAIIEAINDLIIDIDTCHETISEQAVEHIHQKYVLLSEAFNHF